MKLLNGLSRSEFLSTHWQKKPLLIRQAISNFTSPISADELAGLACENNVESRLVMGDQNDADWQCEYGPFDESRFESLADKNWTLLVQSVDHHIADIGMLLEQFDFIPNWRVDDVMFSYAVEGGSVGPHLDNYDVFLLQAQGRRHWHINESDFSDDDFIPGLDIKILEDFTAEQDWLLEPGDMLYLPPGVAHHGIALDDCITISIGFRAPNDQELLTAFVDHLVTTQKPFFYTDPDLTLQNHCGEIEQQHIDYIHQLMIDRIVNDPEFAIWFGRYITEQKTELPHETTESDFAEFEILLKQHNAIQRHGDIRISYLIQDSHIDLFIAGQHQPLELNQLEFIKYLTQHRNLKYSDITGFNNANQALNLIFSFYQRNFFYFDESTNPAN